MKCQDIPCTFQNLNEPKCNNICNLGGDIQTPVNTLFNENQDLNSKDCKSHNKWAIKLNSRSSETLITVFIDQTPIV